MRKLIIISGLAFFGFLLVVSSGYGKGEQAAVIEKYEAIDRPAKIRPDYSLATIPPNIAPLNFVIKEKGSEYMVKIYSENGEAIDISGKSPKIEIAVDKWHKLLEKNKGKDLHFDIFARVADKGWNKFNTITNKIAADDIDNYIFYRRTHPTFTLTRGQISIYQRDLRSFDEKVVIENSHYKAGCSSCHTFNQYKPDDMMLGIRNVKYGAMTLFVKDGKVSKVGAKIGYTALHPSGKLVSYSINDLPMFFHGANPEVRDTVDMDSAILYYPLAPFPSKTVNISPEFSRLDFLETWPTWTADGKYMYFCTSPLTWLTQKKVPPDGYDKVKYELVRISYDIDNDKWGKIETVLSAEDTGKSIAMPRISPDGRWLMFCMCDYGCFPPWQLSSDLYIMDLNAARQTGKSEYRKLELNSDQSEAWHSWSSNNRWVIFSSKRDYSLFTKCYISFIDEKGKATKPIVVPAKDPEFYDRCLDVFTNTEFAKGPLTVTGEKLSKAIRSTGVKIEMPAAITSATPSKKGGTKYEELE